MPIINWTQEIGVLNLKKYPNGVLTALKCCYLLFISTLE